MFIISIFDLASSAPSVWNECMTNFESNGTGLITPTQLVQALGFTL